MSKSSDDWRKWLENSSQSSPNIKTNETQGELRDRRGNELLLNVVVKPVGKNASKEVHGLKHQNGKNRRMKEEEQHNDLPLERIR